ncbi:MAG: hypothetical protein CMC91_05120 [Flavobacteriaceae bacterium]|nr:hypothetical protein [Flavobacteriaceae bacterium]
MHSHMVKTSTLIFGIINLISFSCHMSKKSVLVFTGSPMVIPLVCGALSDENIFPIVKNEAESARLAGFGINSYDQRVFVNKNEVKKALEIINSLKLSV